MKTNRFDESIRRKLDSIEPTYHETDWKHMQQSLRQSGIPTTSPFFSQWMMQAAAAVTVIGLSVATIWQYRTNQELQQTVRTLGDTIARLEKAQSTRPAEDPATTGAQSIPTADAGQTRQPDTVYVTRYVPTPVRPEPTTTNTGPALSDDRSGASSEKAAVEPQRVLTDRSTPVAGLPVEESSGNRPDERKPVDRSPDSEKASGIARSGPPSATDPASPTLADRTDGRVPAEETTGTRLVEGKSAGNRPFGSAPKKGADGTGPVVPSGERTSAGQSRDTYARRSATSDRSGRGSNAFSAGNAAGTFSPEAGRSDRPAGSDRLLQLDVKPLAASPLRFDSVYFVESYNRQARRIRRFLPSAPAAYAGTASPVKTTKPEKPAVEEPMVSLRFRLGPAGELSTSEWSYGLYTEMLLGKHFTLGLGLNRINRRGDDFRTEEEFDRKNFNPNIISGSPTFRHTYALGIQDKHKIQNISFRNTSWQLPVSLGYRLPLGNSISITPTAGASLSILSREKVGFVFVRGPGDLKTSHLNVLRPPVYSNTWVFSAVIEKQWRHWAIQTGPYLSTPMRKAPVSVGFDQVTAGIRARVLYQF